MECNVKRYDQLSSDSELNDLLRDEDMSYNGFSGIMRELRNGSRPKADILQGTGITPEVRAQFFMDELYCFSDIDDDEHARALQVAFAMCSAFLTSRAAFVVRALCTRASMSTR